MSIEQLQKQAQLAYDHEAARRNIKHQMTNRLTVNYDGGIFAVTKEQICFLNLLGDRDVVLLDEYDTPITVNAPKLYDMMLQRYYEIMNEWKLAWEEQTKIRSAKNV
jgi:hypothetical protein